MKLIITALFVIIAVNFSLAQTRGIIVENVQSNTIPGNTYAIVIGISKYKNIQPLKYADKDAISFFDYLVSDKGMNINKANIALCINEDANISNVGNKVSDILQKDIKKGDRVIFFFAGHGDYDAKIMKDQSLLLLQGAPNGNYFQNVFSGDYISTSDLHIKFTSELIKRGAEVILIIDACHSGGMNSQLAGGEQGGIITANALNTIQSTVKMYSCQSSQYSIESIQFGGGSGLFSYVLMEGLYGMADVNNDSIVTMKELQRYLEDNVSALAQPNKQEPVVKTEDNTLVISKVNGTLLADYKKTKDKNLTFLATASVKGNDDKWLAAMDSNQQKLYKRCRLLIESKELNEAYQIYKQFELKDKTSEASILLRRNLSAALQEKTAIILTPMLEDVSKFNSANIEVIRAKEDLDKAAELLGKEHFLYDKLQARSLFLKVLSYILDDKDRRKTKEHIDYLELSASLEPSAPYTYFYLYELYDTEGNIPEAEKNINIYLNLIPNSSWAHNNYGILLANLKRNEEAEKEYKLAILIDSNHANAYCNYGKLLYDLDRNEEAERVFIHAIKLNQSFAIAHNNYGALLARLQRYEEAEIEYEKAIKIDSNYADAYYNYGNLLYDLKRNNEAEKQYQKSIILDSNYSDAHLNYGNLLNKLKRYEEAEYEYKKVIELDSNASDAHFNYGSLLDGLNRYEEAENEYKKAISLDSNYASAHNNYGLLLYYTNRFEEAEKEYKKAIEIKSNFLNAHYNYGSLLKSLKRYTEAENEYKKVIELDPNDPYAYYKLSCLNSLQNKTKKAIDYLKSALQKNFNNLWYMNQDKDIDNIRTMRDFKKTMAKFFTKEALDKYPDMFVVKKK